MSKINSLVLSAAFLILCACPGKSDNVSGAGGGDSSSGSGGGTVVALADAGTGGAVGMTAPATAEAFCALADEAACQWLANVGLFELEDCRYFNSKSPQKRVRELGICSQLKNKRVEYDSTHALDCLDAIAKQKTRFVFEAAAYATCQLTIKTKPPAAPNGACYDNYDCQEQQSCPATQRTCPTLCVDRVAVGSKTTPLQPDCVKGAFRYQGICYPKISDGMDCSPFFPIGADACKESGSFCDKGVCSKRNENPGQPVGAVCDPARQVNCQSRLFCDSGICATPGGVGERCVANSCKQGLACTAGKCARLRLQEGSSCDPQTEGQCDLNLACLGSSSGSPATCKSKRSLGQTCGTDGSLCAEGSFCSPETSLCQRYLSVGDVCFPRSQGPNSGCDNSKGSSCSPLTYTCEQTRCVAP